MIPDILRLTVTCSGRGRGKGGAATLALICIIAVFPAGQQAQADGKRQLQIWPDMLKYLDKRAAQQSAVSTAATLRDLRYSPSSNWLLASVTVRPAAFAFSG